MFPLEWKSNMQGTDYAVALKFQSKKTTMRTKETQFSTQLRTVKKKKTRADGYFR